MGCRSQEDLLEGQGVQTRTGDQVAREDPAAGAEYQQPAIQDN